MSKTLKTLDFSKFKKHENNVPLDETNLHKIINSIKFKNLLEFRPIMVDHEFRVIDGQHRLEAAKTLNVEIYYQVSENCPAEDIILLNTNQRNWGVNEYIHFYCSKGNENYIKLRDLCLKFNLKPWVFLRKTTYRSGQSNNLIKNGQYKFPEQSKVDIFTNATIRADVSLEKIKELCFNKNFLNSSKIRDSLIRLFYNPNVSVDVFLNKVYYRSEMVKPCSSVDVYLRLFIDIYNWKNHSPIGVDGNFEEE